MANLKISQLPVSTALQGTEAIVVVQSNTTKQSTINKIKNTGKYKNKKHRNIKNTKNTKT